MIFPSIDIQGSILNADLLARIRSEQADFQQGKDFIPGFTNAKLKDEISLAWQEAKGQWIIFKSKLDRLKEGETGTTETRNFWISPLLTNLGYNLSFNRQAEELAGKSFPIGHRDSNLDGFPVYVGGFHESLDKRPENKALRVSPHAMLQEYLNHCEHLYGLVTNGRHLRLLRDASRITRLSYLEFDLEKMMEEDLYSDFVILYRVLHASRMPRQMDAGAESIVEAYHQQGLVAGSTIRDKLGNAVKEAILQLANEFLNHPHNQELRKVFADGQLDLDDYYRRQLRIIYRLLFLFVIEERNLVYADGKTSDTKRFAQIYFNSFSLMRLRKLARKLHPPEAHRHYDLWQGLVSTFSLFEQQEIGEKLGIMSLQGDLFGYNAISDMYYDLHECRISNAVLLDIIRSLGYFENEQHVLIPVNYGGLDVEEFGSVYEGLLELKFKVDEVPGTDRLRIDFDKSSERGSSGSHYTPEELVQPLIKHSLEYLIGDRVKPFQEKKVSREATVQALLGLRICDVACGSGHILLSAARRVALEVARVQTDEEQPNPQSIRKAMKTVIRHCIYGVDKNPLAVELCKVALWLEAHNPGEPLNFLDHHIKCGDAIVGLAHREELMRGIATEAFKALPGDDKEVARGLAKRNKKERETRGQQVLDFEGKLKDGLDDALVAYRAFEALPETTPEQIAAKAQAYERVRRNGALARLKEVADLQVAQFFIPKTLAKKDRLVTDALYFRLLDGRERMETFVATEVKVESTRRRFFHWFLEFPEVFSGATVGANGEQRMANGGFDCILGNPPYLSGLKISTNYGDAFREIIYHLYPGLGGPSNLIGYFLRRIFSITGNNRFFSIIASSIISQGETLIGGLDMIARQGATIVFAETSIEWPGVANVRVSPISVFYGEYSGKKLLNRIEVDQIPANLGTMEGDNSAFPLIGNANISFVGTALHGIGFSLEHSEVQTILDRSPSEGGAIKSYINGYDLNNSPNQSSSRYVIDFSKYAEKDAKKHFPLCFEAVYERVRPDRLKNKRKSYVDYWWQHGEKRPQLYATIAPLSNVLVRTQASKHNTFVILPTANQVFDQKVIVWASAEYTLFSTLMCSFHEVWFLARKSDLGETPNYSPSAVFEPYPIRNSIVLGEIGETYHEHRRQLMLGMQLGLTKTYNLFHARDLRPISAAEEALDDKAFAKLLGKDALSLRKHLAKTPDAPLTFNESVAGIQELRRLHVEMDNAVAAAYGWSFDSAQEPAIDLRHDFYEVDYLPENDRVRFTIHPDARREVLKRLLALNHKIHAEEVKAGLWDKKKSGKGKKNVAATTKKDPGDVEGQIDMFGNAVAPVAGSTAPKRGRGKQALSAAELVELFGDDTEKGGGSEVGICEVWPLA